MTETTKERIHFRRAFLTGFVALFPLVLTIIVLVIVWRYLLAPVSKPLGDLIDYVVETVTPLKQVPGWAGMVAALVLLLAFLYALGLILTTFVGQRLLRWMEGWIVRLPIVSSIYPHAKRFSDFLFGEKKMRFRRVVLVEYPRKGIYSLGFATSSGPDDAARKVGREMTAVFIPTSPAPVTGWTVLVPSEDVIDLDLTVDEAVRFTVSCGVLTPESARLEPPPEALPPPPGAGAKGTAP